MCASHDIQRLCESWWNKLAEASREEHRRFAVQFLALHGWDSPVAVETRAVSAQPGTLSYLVREGARPPFAAHFVPAGLLEPARTVVERGLDFCPATRILVAATRALDVHYAFITDLFRSYLYDARTGELLLHADTPAEYVAEFGDRLHEEQVAGGALHEARRQPRSYAARQLREWMQRWCETLQVDWRAPEETAWLAMDRLVVLRYLVEHDILRRPGWRLAKQFAEVLALASSASPDGAGKALVSLFQDIARAWNAELFAPQPPLEAILEQDRVAAPLLREFVLLSRSKFNVATVLESFNYGDASEKARVRMIPEENPERVTMLAKQTPGTIDEMQLELDVSDEGYRAIFHWVDRLTDLYGRLANEFQAARYPRDTGEGEFDLFDWSAIETARPNALTDPFQHVVEHGLIVYCATPRQFRTARLMLYLHLIRRYQEAKTRLSSFPRIEAMLQPRPTVLESDRRRIYQANRGDEWEVI
ncbi:MAG: hypothetical protein JXR94_07835 [Candidatus Hydrogenedentes bacterium]|nr:hypothetical protein [Candidatus Hydrogenedentota bacterium]